MFPINSNIRRSILSGSAFILVFFPAYFTTVNHYEIELEGKLRAHNLVLMKCGRERERIAECMRLARKDILRGAKYAFNEFQKQSEILDNIGVCGSYTQEVKAYITTDYKGLSIRSRGAKTDHTDDAIDCWIGLSEKIAFEILKNEYDDSKNELKSEILYLSKLAWLEEKRARVRAMSLIADIESQGERLEILSEPATSQSNRQSLRKLETLKFWSATLKQRIERNTISVKAMELRGQMEILENLSSLPKDEDLISFSLSRKTDQLSIDDLMVKFVIIFLIGYMFCWSLICARRSFQLSYHHGDRKHQR